MLSVVPALLSGEGLTVEFVGGVGADADIQSRGFARPQALVMLEESLSGSQCYTHSRVVSSQGGFSAVFRYWRLSVS